MTRWKGVEEEKVQETIKDQEKQKKDQKGELYWIIQK